MRSARQRGYELYRFAIVGGATALIYFGLLLVSVEGLGVSPSSGAALSYVLAILFNYSLHKAWTFDSKVGHSTSAPRFAVFVVLSFAANVLLMSYGPALLHVHYLVIQVASAVMLVAVSYLMQKFWIFKAGKTA